MKLDFQFKSNRSGYSQSVGIRLTLAISVAAVAVQTSPCLGEALQWTRDASSTRQAFGWLTCHLAHWTWEHLVWDLFAFLVLSRICIRVIPERYGLCLVLSATTIPLEILLHQPQFDSYRGLSGIDSALLGLLLAGLWHSPPKSPKAKGQRLLAVVGGWLFLAKTVFELTTGDTLFLGGDQPLFVPATSAHLMGWSTGIVAGFLPSFREQDIQSPLLQP